MSRTLRVCLLLGLSVLAMSAGAEVKKWVDEQGRTHYGDRPPVGKPGAVADLRGTVSVGDGITLVPAAPEAGGAARPLAMAAPPRGEVWIYTTPRCVYCKRAMAHMQEQGVRFREKDIRASAQYDAEFRALGGRGVPVTLAGAQRINGYKRRAFDEFLKSAGF